MLKQTHPGQIKGKKSRTVLEIPGQLATMGSGLGTRHVITTIVLATSCSLAMFSKAESD